MGSDPQETGVEGDSLARPPRGFDCGHRFIDDLKMKAFVTSIAYTRNRFVVRSCCAISNLPVGKCRRWLSSSRRRWGRNIDGRRGHAGHHTVGVNRAADDEQQHRWQVTLTQRRRRTRPTHCPNQCGAHSACSRPGSLPRSSGAFPQKHPPPSRSTRHIPHTGSLRSSIRDYGTTERNRLPLPQSRGGWHAADCLIRTFSALVRVGKSTVTYREAQDVDQLTSEE